MDLKHENGAGTHHLISPTARFIAFLRSFSDIPNAKAISDDIDGELVTRKIYPEEHEFLIKLTAPIAEARYKCFDRFIQDYTNILELAVGTSIVRGVEIVNRHPDKTYVGTDLPDMIKETLSLFGKYYSRRDNHHLLPANVLCQEQVTAAADIFGRGKILIVNEGLWMYLSPEERITAAKNIRSILKRSGGAWITPDFTDREYERQLLSSLDPDVQTSFEKANAAVKKMTDRDTVAFLPENSAEVHQFFRATGLQAEVTPMIDSSMNLSSLERLWGERSYPYEGLLRSGRLWIIRCADEAAAAAGHGVDR